MHRSHGVVPAQCEDADCPIVSGILAGQAELSQYDQKVAASKPTRMYSRVSLLTRIFMPYLKPTLLCHMRMSLCSVAVEAPVDTKNVGMSASWECTRLTRVSCGISSREIYTLTAQA